MVRPLQEFIDEEDEQLEQGGGQQGRGRARHRQQQEAAPPRGSPSREHGVDPQQGPRQGGPRHLGLRVQWMRLREARLIRIQLVEGMRELGDSEAVRRIFSPPSEGEIMRQRLQHRPVTRSQAAERSNESAELQQLRGQHSQEREDSSVSRRPNNPLRPNHSRPTRWVVPESGSSNGRPLLMDRHWLIRNNTQVDGMVGTGSGTTVGPTPTRSNHRPSLSQCHPTSSSVNQGKKRQREEQEEPLAGSSRETEEEYNLRLKRRRLEAGCEIPMVGSSNGNMVSGCNTRLQMKRKESGQASSQREGEHHEKAGTNRAPRHISKADTSSNSSEESVNMRTSKGLKRKRSRYEDEEQNDKGPQGKRSRGGGVL